MAALDVEPSDAIVLFGATGDLARKKLLPAIYNMQRHGTLKGVPVVGVSSSEWTADDLRARAEEAVTASLKGEPIDQVAFDAIAALFDYVSGDYREADTFERLAATLRDKGVQRPLFYLAIPPNMFDDVVDGLSGVGLADGAGMVIWGTLLQRRVPTEMLGRVSSLDFFVSLAFMPLSFAIVGPLSKVVTMQTIFLVAGIAPVILAAIALVAAKMRQDELAHPLR